MKERQRNEVRNHETRTLSQIGMDGNQQKPIDVRAVYFDMHRYDPDVLSDLLFIG